MNTDVTGVLAFSGQSPLTNDCLDDLLNPDYPELKKAAEEAIREAERILGIDPLATVREADSKTLADTAMIQPIDAIIDEAYLRVAVPWLRDQGITDWRYVGKSRGEYTALRAAGMIDFATLVEMMRIRSWIMNEEIRRVERPAEQEYVLARVVGISEYGSEGLGWLCDLTGAYMSNIDRSVMKEPETTQIIVGGERKAVANLLDLAIARGANPKFTKILAEFYIPYHIPVPEMMEIGQRVNDEVIGPVNFNAPNGRVYLSTEGRTISVDDLRAGVFGLHNVNPVMLNCDPSERRMYYSLENGESRGELHEGVLRIALNGRVRSKDLAILLPIGRAGVYRHLVPPTEAPQVRITSPRELYAAPAAIAALRH